MFEIKNLETLKFFLQVRVFINENYGIVSLVQNIYIKKLMRKYQLDIIKKELSVLVEMV